MELFRFETLEGKTEAQFETIDNLNELVNVLADKGYIVGRDKKDRPVAIFASGMVVRG